MTKNNKIFIIITACFLSIIFAPQASAASEDELYKRALLNTMSNCYKEGEMYTSVTAGGTDGFTSFESSILRKGKKQSNILIPTGIGAGNKLGANAQSDGTKIGCYELFLGDKTALGTYDGTMTGLLSLYGKDVPDANSTGLPSFLNGMGYTEKSSVGNSKKSCLTAKYKDINISGNDYSPIGKVCWADADLDGTKEGPDLMYSYERIEESDFIIMSPIFDQYGLSIYFNIPQAAQSCETNKIYKYGYVIDDIKSMATPCSISWTDHYHKDTGEWTNDFYEIAVTYSSENAGDSFSKYKMESTEIHSGKFTAAYSKARKYLSGESSKQAFSDDDKYELYSLYLTKVYQIQSSNNTDCQAQKPAQAIENTVDGTKYYVHTSNGWCRIAIDESKTSKSTKVSGFTSDERYILNTSYDFEGLLNAMFVLDINEEETAIDPVPSPLPISPEEKPGDPCFDNAGAIGWILCPIIATVSDLGNKVYNDIETNFLQIKVQDLFENKYPVVDKNGNPVLDDEGKQKTENGVQAAWEVMRNIANAIFIIILLVVIFSQITGVGIDNYGIKKILPKLITTAMLVNLSFIICELAIDLSNILGVGLRNMLVGMSSGITIPGGAGGYDFGQYVLVVGGGAAAVLAVMLLTYGGIGSILLLAMAAISFVTAILMLFAILVIRQAGVVICVVIAPVAFACNMLPNTEKFFKKWIDLVKNLLLVYPICGLVMGAGAFVSKVLASIGGGGNMMFALAAMLVEVIPFFFIPTILKKSLSAMGNLGATLSNFGKRASGSLNRRIGRSEAMKYSRQTAADRRAGIDSKGNLTRMGKVKAKFAGTGVGKTLGYNRSLARRQELAKRNVDADTAAQGVLMGNVMDYDERKSGNIASEESYQEKLAAAIRNNDNQAYQAVLGQYQRHYGASKAANGAMKVNKANHGVGLLDNNHSAGFLRELNEKYGQTFAKTPDYAKYLAAGGNGKSFDNYLRDDFEIGDLKDNQIVSANGQTLERMITAGKLTQADSQRIMANKANREKMDSVQQLILAHHAAHGGEAGYQALTKAEAEASLAGRAQYVSSTDSDGNRVYSNTRLTAKEASNLVRQLPEEVTINQVATNNVPVNVTGELRVHNNEPKPPRPPLLPPPPST